MRIVHACLSNWFVDNVGYQENELVKHHIADGHEVYIIASTETLDSTGKITYLSPSSYKTNEGAHVIRISYRRFLPITLIKKLRLNVGFEKLLLMIQPDVILFHGTCGWELLTAAAFIHKNPQTLFYVDSHEDIYNSAKNWFSREILHKQYYGRILRRAMPAVKKILCYSPESINFVHKTYRVPKSMLELYPLGGTILSDSEYNHRRYLTRKSYALSSDQIVLIQAGKQTARKKLLYSIEAFMSCKDDRLAFIIAGFIDSAIKDRAIDLIRTDSRIKYLGWQSYDDLTSLLCAADVYLQPGTQSVTMQHSLCCRCAVILDDVPSHYFYVHQNGWLIGKDGSLQDLIRRSTYAEIAKMKEYSYCFAKDNLDYRVLARRIFF